MAVKNIIHDQLFLMQKSTLANAKDMQVAVDLRDTLLANRNKAAGLAANMIGEAKRIIAFYIVGMPMVMFNPKIIQKGNEYLATEGCLSLNSERPVKRYEHITVKYQNINLEYETQEFSGFVAETIQHEIDHCDGKII